ncbi:leucyl/phenylalanyl-tRNA--protein transferase [Komagataeibacter kakiaceti JCM 25156]|uniref:leucyl/phenylalanyl-tRNA--protein transferase n=1 Tax=Komagataeibacter kakiaceti TaxID=943261 RepID=UPI000470CBB7|nr:leucyl/phenylalanyl-tRNA--protein transferase [Komagataeibacter kakiaceti]
MTGQETVPLTPELMLSAYRGGLFPMAPDAQSDELEWFCPEWRGILPLDGFHLSRRLMRTVLSPRFDVVTDRDFPAVMDGCAAPAPGREKTWINPRIRDLFCQLHTMGYAHSVESWHDGRLVGGLYGVAIGQAFFGESMFSRMRDASKVALVHLVARLRLGGFTLLDTQFGTEHLASFGGTEIPVGQYMRLLRHAVEQKARWIGNDSATELEGAIRALRAAEGAGG